MTDTQTTTAMTQLAEVVDLLVIEVGELKESCRDLRQSIACKEMSLEQIARALENIDHTLRQHLQ